jgi:uncharacterized protein (UPF0261 family)
MKHEELLALADAYAADQYARAALSDALKQVVQDADEYQRAADAMAAAHKVERDALLNQRHADEALMREALDTFRRAEPDVQFVMMGKLRARLGGV